MRTFIIPHLHHSKLKQIMSHIFGNVSARKDGVVIVWEKSLCICQMKNASCKNAKINSFVFLKTNARETTIFPNQDLFVLFEGTLCYSFVVFFVIQLCSFYNNLNYFLHQNSCEEYFLS